MSDERLSDREWLAVTFAGTLAGERIDRTYAELDALAARVGELETQLAAMDASNDRNLAAALRLERRIEGVRALHHDEMSEVNGRFCGECGHSWPCRTQRALLAAVPPETPKEPE